MMMRQGVSYRYGQVSCLTNTGDSRLEYSREKFRELLLDLLVVARISGATFERIVVAVVHQLVASVTILRILRFRSSESGRPW